MWKTRAQNYFVYDRIAFSITLTIIRSSLNHSTFPDGFLSKNTQWKTFVKSVPAPYLTKSAIRYSASQLHKSGQVFWDTLDVRIKYTRNVCSIYKYITWYFFHSGLIGGRSWLSTTHFNISSIDGLKLTKPAYGGLYWSTSERKKNRIWKFRSLKEYTI